MSKELEALQELYHEREYTYAESVNHKSKKWANDIKHYDNIGNCLAILETALKRLENYEKNEDFSKDIINYAFLSEKDKIKKLRALEIVKESIGLKMSVDEDIGCLYVPITKCFQPLEQNICIVGYVKGKDKIDLLKEVLL